MATGLGDCVTERKPGDPAHEVSWTSTVIDLDGLSATNGAERSGTYELPGEQAEVDLLSEISCGDLTMVADGIREPS